MRVLSLFDGIAGARQALKELNIDCEYYASEIDKWGIQIAKANHPDIMHIGDVKDLWFNEIEATLCAPQKWINWNDQEKKGDFKSTMISLQGGTINLIDLLIGGSPCQDLSIAKRDRKGLEGDRSSLFYEYVRILKEVKPRYFILENVASMSNASKNLISKELFGITPTLINSALLTAQQRKRLYWVGELVGSNYKKIEIKQPINKEIYLKDILEKDVEEKYYLSQKMINYITPSGTKSYKITNQEFNPDKSYPLTSTMHKMHRLGVDTYIKEKPARLGHFNKGGQADRVYPLEGKSICLSSLGGGGGAKTGLYDDGEVRKLTPIECERLQGFPDNYTNCVSNAQRYKALGNSFTVPVIKHILQGMQ